MTNGNTTTAGTIGPTTTVGELVAEHPGRSVVMEQYKIDYCCGGKKTLAEVCRQKGLPLEEVIARLSEVDGRSDADGESAWTKATLKQLIEHIVTCYHVPLKEGLPRIVQLADKVAAVHGERHPEMVELARGVRCFKEQLEMHMQKEEVILFPTIINIESGSASKFLGCGGSIEHPIAVMLQEHDEAGAAMELFRKLTNDYTPPADACNTFKVLLYSLSKMESEMHVHVHKENSILFPRAMALQQA